MARTLLLAFICALSSLSCKSLLKSGSSSELNKAISTGQASSLEPLCNKGVMAACALTGAKPAEAEHVVPILQSWTSNTQSRFVIQVPKDEDLIYVVKSGANLWPLIPDRYSRTTSDLVEDQVEAFNLSPGTNYELFVLNSDGRVWDRRQFRSLNMDQKRVRLAAVSCMDDNLRAVALKMWPQLAKQKPDVILLMGDNVYADHSSGKWIDTTPEVLWRRYTETRENLPIFKTNPLIPMFAIWDDHDFGHNDSDRTYPYKDQSLEVFLSFFAQRKPAPGFERGPGVSSWINAFHVQLGMLDDRYYRSPNGVDIPDQTHLGPDQDKWVAEHVQAAKTPVLLVDGDQFFGGYHKFESYEGSHPKSFKAALEQWKKTKVPLLFVSGDRHLSEILKVPSEALGFPTFEITSSGIHAHVFAGAFKKDPSPNQLVGVDGVYNYSILELMRSGPTLLQVSVQAFGPEDKLLYQKTLTVKR
jgi:hypothetical protein